MSNKILEKRNIENKKVENIYFMKCIIMDNQQTNRKKKIKDIINKNRIYKDNINNISEIDKLAYNI